MKDNAAKWLSDLLNKWGVDEGTADRMEQFITLGIILIIAVAANFVLKHLLLGLINKLLNRFAPGDQVRAYLRNILIRLSNVILVMIVYIFLPAAFPDNSRLLSILLRICMVILVCLIVLILNSGTQIAYHVIGNKKKYKQKPIKGFFQILQIILYFIGFIIIISVIINKSPAGLLTGLGAFAAILSFIFKDTILGFISGIQLSANDMIQPGDWIVVGNSMANGVVTDITLITVKVQNFDNTIVTVPTYSLITNEFQNWRGMSDSGGRRITASIHIDMSSVKFIDDKQNITNLRLYRMYLMEYITGHTQVNHMLTFMVRFLDPGPQGIPVQIYCFSKNKDWVMYEGIKAEIVEHAVAMCRIYGLEIFQLVVPPEQISS